MKFFRWSILGRNILPGVGRRAPAALLFLRKNAALTSSAVCRKTCAALHLRSMICISVPLFIRWALCIWRMLTDWKTFFFKKIAYFCKPNAPFSDYIYRNRTADAAALPNYSTIHTGGRHEYRRKDTGSAQEPRNNADAAGSRTWCVVSGGEQMGVRGFPNLKIPH